MLTAFDVKVTRLLKEAPDDEPWGDVAFGEERPGAKELNTPSESETLVDLIKHFKDEEKLSKQQAKQLQQFGKDERYSDVLNFDEQAHPVVYRGMGVPLDYLSKIVNVAPEEIHDGDVFEVDFFARPRGASTASWTVSLRSAHRFAKTFSSKGAGIVLHAQTSDNPGAFVINTDNIYDVTPIRKFKLEQEVIGIGPITVFKIEVVESMNDEKPEPREQ